jgi:hypothetical protein
MEDMAMRKRGFARANAVGVAVLCSVALGGVQAHADVKVFPGAHCEAGGISNDSKGSAGIQNQNSNARWYTCPAANDSGTGRISSAFANVGGTAICRAVAQATNGNGTFGSSKTHTGSATSWVNLGAVTAPGSDKLATYSIDCYLHPGARISQYYVDE